MSPVPRSFHSDEVLSNRKSLERLKSASGCGQSKGLRPGSHHSLPTLRKKSVIGKPPNPPTLGGAFIPASHQGSHQRSKTEYSRLVNLFLVLFTSYDIDLVSVIKLDHGLVVGIGGGFDFTGGGGGVGGLALHGWKERDVLRS